MPKKFAWKRFIPECLMRKRFLKNRFSGELAVGYFNQLPDEMVLEIFTHLPSKDLPRLAMVSRRWHRLSMDRSLWKNVNLNSAKIPLRVLIKLIESKTEIRKLSLRNATIEDPESWTGIYFGTKYKSHLRVLDLSNVTISPEGLEGLLKPLTGLVELHITNCRLNAGCCELIGNSSHLKILNLAGCKDITATLKNILLKCRRFQHLNLSGIKLTDTAPNCLRIRFGSAAESPKCPAYRKSLSWLFFLDKHEMAKYLDLPHTE